MNEKKEVCSTLVEQNKDGYVTSHFQTLYESEWKIVVNHEVGHSPVFVVQEDFRDYQNKVIEKSYRTPSLAVMRDIADCITQRRVPVHREPAFYALVRTGAAEKTHYKPFPILAEAIFSRKADRWQRRQWEAIMKFCGIETVRSA